MLGGADCQNIYQNLTTNYPPPTFLQSAHMAVTEALMSLFLKESVSTSRVLRTVRRMDKNSKALDNGDLESSGGLDPDSADPEEALLLWVSESCRAVKKKAMDEVVGGGREDKDSDQVRDTL